MLLLLLLVGCATVHSVDHTTSAQPLHLSSDPVPEPDVFNQALSWGTSYHPTRAQVGRAMDTLDWTWEMRVAAIGISVVCCLVCLAISVIPASSLCQFELLATIPFALAVLCIRVYQADPDTISALASAHIVAIRFSLAALCLTVCSVIWLHIAMEAPEQVKPKDDLSHALRQNLFDEYSGLGRRIYLLSAPFMWIFHALRGDLVTISICSIFWLLLLYEPRKTVSNRSIKLACYGFFPLRVALGLLGLLPQLTFLMVSIAWPVIGALTATSVRETLTDSLFVAAIVFMFAEDTLPCILLPFDIILEVIAVMVKNTKIEYQVQHAERARAVEQSQLCKSLQLD